MEYSCQTQEYDVFLVHFQVSFTENFDRESLKHHSVIEVFHFI